MSGVTDDGSTGMAGDGARLLAYLSLKPAAFLRGDPSMNSAPDDVVWPLVLQ